MIPARAPAKPPAGWRRRTEIGGRDDIKVALMVRDVTLVLHIDLLSVVGRDLLVATYGY